MDKTALLKIVVVAIPLIIAAMVATKNHIKEKEMDMVRHQNYELVIPKKVNG